ncbi:MAG TPA: ABC transporter permease [Enterovirga sp.]|jgi:predicted permease|nr:ABC transporter permease [Enterovirga sp.]
MNDLVQDLRYALRQMARKPGITAFTVLSLALGIGVNSSIFSLVNALLFRDLPGQRTGELVDVYVGEGKFRYATSSYPDYKDLRDQNGVLSGLAAINLVPATWDAGERTQMLFGEEVSGNYFDVFGVRPAVGRWFLPEEDAKPGTHPVVVLGNRFWRTALAGDSRIVGRQLELNGIQFTVVGVAPEQFRGNFPVVASDFWVPMMMSDAMAEEPSLDDRRSRSLFLKGRLAPGTSMEQAQARFDGLAQRLRTAYPVEDGKLQITLVPSRKVILNPGIDGPIFGVAGLLMGIVGLVLLIACSNIANLQLVRVSERRREIAVRLALGAGRGRLMRQLLTESMLLALAGGAAGLLFAVWTARLLVTFKPPLPIPLNLDVPLDWRVLGFTLALALVTGILCGLAPALRASRPNVVSEIKDDSAGAAGQGYKKLGLRNVLVISQVATSTILLVGAGLFLRSLGNAQSIDPGFTLRKGVVVQVVPGLGGAYKEAEGRALYQRLLERARALPGVRSAALSETLPLGLNIHISRVDLEGQSKPKEERQEVDRVGVAPGYFATLGIPILRGRAFGEQDAPGTPRVVIVNETGARRFWPGQDPIGRRLRFNDEEPWGTVVGVARDGKYRSLGEEPRSFIYHSTIQDYSSFATLVVASDGNERALLTAVRRELNEIDPGLPIFSLKTMSEHLSIMLFPARMGAALLAAFGGLGLLLASIGLYGVVASSVARRTREVGIRMALGARREDVLGLVVREGMILTSFGLLVGLALAFAASRLMSSLLYGITPADPVTYAAVALVLALVAFLANLLPARRATQVDPVVALRHG